MSPTGHCPRRAAEQDRLAEAAVDRCLEPIYVMLARRRDH
jgi:hypothetical protein